MSVLFAWQPLSVRIHGLNEAAKLDAALRPGNPAMTGSTAFLANQCDEIFAELEAFKNSFRNSLPGAALAVLERAARLHSQQLNQPGATREVNRGLTSNSLVHLQAIESAITFSLSGLEEQVLSTTERALQHLQRSLFVDDLLRQRWLNAFDKREEQIEALGAVHLLGHGIFAFKVNAAGARTDLVLPDSVPRDVARYSTGIVLTEWKLTRPKDKPEAKFAEARTQAALYASGPLAAMELRRTRYAIVVSKQIVQCPPDEECNGVVYRNVNISLSPARPSTVARARK